MILHFRLEMQNLCEYSPQAFLEHLLSMGRSPRNTGETKEHEECFIFPVSSQFSQEIRHMHTGNLNTSAWSEFRSRKCLKATHKQLPNEGCTLPEGVLEGASGTNWPNPLILQMGTLRLRKAK